MSEQSTKPAGGEGKGIGTLGWVLIIVLGIILLPYLISFVFGVAGLAFAAAWGAIGAVLGAIGAAFGVVLGLLGAAFGVLVSFSVVLLLLLPGIIIGVLLARSMSRRENG